VPLLTTQSARSFGLNKLDIVFANDYEYIGSVTATGSESSFSINVPNTYKHLQIRSLTKDSRTNTNAPLWINPNGDTVSANYAVIYMYSFGTSGSVGNGYSSSEGGISAVGAGGGPGGTAVGTDIFGGGVTTIFDYNNSGDELTANSGGMWKSTSAITSITLRPFTAPFKANSTIAIYGLKG
jgi:hypothetical protein